VALAAPVFAEVRRRYPDLERTRLIHEAVRRLIDRMVNDLLAESGRRLAESAPQSAEAVRALGRPVAAFSAEMAADERALKKFLHHNMYRHYKVMRMADKARHIVSELFALFLAAPERLPDEWRARAGEPGAPPTARVAADFIAGMTDRFAIQEHSRLFNTDSSF